MQERASRKAPLWKAPLWKAKPCSSTGRAEGQDEAPFSLKREIMHFKSEGNESHTDAALSSVAWRLEAITSALARS